MKIKLKIILALGTITAGTAAIIPYGIYSTIKFNEQFEGNGYYYKGQHFNTRFDAEMAVRKEMLKSFPKSAEVNNLKISLSSLDGESGEVSEVFTFGNPNPVSIRQNTVTSKVILAHDYATTVGESLDDVYYALLGNMGIEFADDGKYTKVRFVLTDGHINAKSNWSTNKLLRSVLVGKSGFDLKSKISPTETADIKSVLKWTITDTDLMSFDISGSKIAKVGK